MPPFLRADAVTASKNGTDQQQRRRTKRFIIHDRPCNEVEINGLCRELSELCKCACFWLRTDTNVVTSKFFVLGKENNTGIPTFTDFGLKL